MGRPLPAAHDRALGRLAASRALAGFYLAGGSAVAWHLRHRVSRDLDLFCDEQFDPEALRERLAASGVQTTLVSRSDIMLRVDLDGVPIDLVWPIHPLLEQPVPGPHGIPLAGLRDLGAMKLSTIARRGLYRDFWDLATIVERGGLSLPEIAAAYLEKYGVGASELYHAARGLTYFADTEKEDRPRGLTRRRWEEIKRLFLRLAPALLEAPSPAREPRRRARRRASRRR